jgi:hypothetical protein
MMSLEIKMKKVHILIVIFMALSGFYSVSCDKSDPPENDDPALNDEDAPLMKARRKCLTMLRM